MFSGDRTAKILQFLKLSKRSLMPPKGKAAPNARKGKGKAYTLATIDAEGKTVVDIFKKEWLIGKPVGVGGFGKLYQVTDVSGNTGSDYVLKIEPKSNGPLFSEQSFYQRKAKKEDVLDWMKSHKMKRLGMPFYITFGLHTVGKDEYRFLIIPRFSTDLQKLFTDCSKVFPVKTVLTIGLQVLDVLEYLHDNEYVHADIKAGNLMLGLQKADANQVYLVDYGLAYRYKSNGKVADYKPDPKRAHDGTIEFTSRDAHLGCSPSCRGDLEILGYCMLQWINSVLPWEKNLQDPEKVKSQKIDFMKEPKSSIKNLEKDIPECLVRYMQYVAEMQYEDSADFNKLRKIVRDYMKKHKIADDGKLSFPSASKPTKRKSTETELSPKKRKKIAAGDVAGPSNRNNSCAVKIKKTATKRKAASVSPSKEKTIAAEKRKDAARTALKYATKTKAVSVSPSKEKTIAAEKRKDAAKTALKHAISPRASPRVKKVKKESATIATQTSPGLKGLKKLKKQSK